MRKNELEAKADLEKRIEKARQRPMLVDSYNDKRHKNLAMMKAMKDVMQTYKDSGIPESQAKKFLSEEQKEALEFAKFKDAQEKRYSTKQNMIRDSLNKPTTTKKIETKVDDIEDKASGGYSDDDGFE